MKTTGKCPKCGGTDLIVIPPSYGVRGNIISGQTIFSFVRCQRYVCGDCGFIEEYVGKQDDIESLRRRYAKR